MKRDTGSAVVDVLTIVGGTDKLRIKMPTSGDAVVGLNVINTGSADLFTILGGGNVGIGKVGPQEKLDVAGNIRITGLANADEGWFGVTTLDNELFSITRQNSPVAGSLSIASFRDIGLAPNFENTTDRADYAVVIKASGDVGIGITAPLSKLEVVDTTSTVPLAIRGASTGVFIRIRAVATTKGFIGWTSLGDDGLCFLNLAGNVANFMVTDAGNAAFGNTSPQARLHITGAADNEQLIVQAHSSQTANILEIQDSSANVLSGVDERGIPFADGNTQTSNVFFGLLAGNVSATGTGNIGIGARATDSVTEGSNNIGVGGNALSAVTTANSNVALGANALSNVVSGSSNMAIGNSALQLNTGANNVAIGGGALVKQTSGNNSVAIGASAGNKNVTGDRNTLIGKGAGLGVEGNSYSDNTFIGWQSGLAITTGSSNIFIGNSSGDKQTSLSNLLIIDNQTRADVATEITNSILYGVMAAAPADQTLRINANVTFPQDVLFSGSGSGLAYGEVFKAGNTVETAIGTSGKANKVQYLFFDTDGPSNNATPDHSNNHVLITKAGVYCVSVCIHADSVTGPAAEFGFSIYKNNGATEVVNLHSHRDFSGGGSEAGSANICGLMDVDGPVVSVDTSYAFVDSGPDTITDSNNNFVNDGFIVGQTLTVAGTDSNDGDYTIAVVAAGTLTLISTDTLTAEDAGDTVTLTGSNTIELWVWNEGGTENIIIADAGISIVQVGGT
jgi:hypothetical protein